MVLERLYPLAYATGECYFGEYPLKISRPVLIPRQDTYAWLSKLILRKEGRLNVLEVGFGSGCISKVLSIHHNVDAIDCSRAAYRIAKSNTYGNNVNLFLGRFEEASISEKYDLIISNPPYIPKKHRSTKVAPSTRCWESAVALHPDDHLGISMHVDIIRRFHKLTSMFAFELDGRLQQYRAVKKYLVEHGFALCQPISDGHCKYRAIFSSIR